MLYVKRFCPASVSNYPLIAIVKAVKHLLPLASTYTGSYWSSVHFFHVFNIPGNEGFNSFSQVLKYIFPNYSRLFKIENIFESYSLKDVIQFFLTSVDMQGKFCSQISSPTFTEFQKLPIGSVPCLVWIFLDFCFRMVLPC